MSNNFRNISLIVVIIFIFLVLSVSLNFDDLNKKAYKYVNGSINIDGTNYFKLYSDDFSYLNLDEDKFPVIAFLNKNNYFKDNIEIREIVEGKLIYINGFQDYVNENDLYIYSGLYINENYYKDFLNNFNFNKYYKDLTIGSDISPTIIDFNETETKLIRNIILITMELSKTYLSFPIK